MERKDETQHKTNKKPRKIKKHTSNIVCILNMVTGTKALAQIIMDDIRRNICVCVCVCGRNSIGLPLLPGNSARDTSIMNPLPNDKV